MSAIPFTRALGARPGVQLNPLKDNTNYPDLSVADQVAAMIGRFDRGRIDKAFLVNANNQSRMLGTGGSMNASALNEPRIQIYEALRDGSAEVLVSRLVPAASVNQFLVAKADPLDANVWTASASPAAGFLLTLKHLECFVDGVTVEIHAAEVLDGEDAQVASKWVKLRMIDPVSGELLYEEFEGSLDPLSKDEFNNSTFLVDVVAAATDGVVEVAVGAAASVAITSAFYGLDEDGAEKYSSKLLKYFTEGGTTYVNTDYDAACKRLQRSQAGFGFIGSGGTQNAALLSRLIALGLKTNKQVRWDIDGSKTPTEAIAFYKTVGGTDSHYSQCFWAPLFADDPLNGGKAYIGTSGINIALACGRNAITNANGIAAKNYPIAGSDYPLTRSGVTQKYDPEETELDALAKAKINPVLFINYSSGGRYAFTDSLTGALTTGDRKLIAVADMSSSVDDVVAQYAQECLQKPMDTAVKRMTDFLQTYFESIETAKWIKPSTELGGRSWVARVTPNAARPNDRMDVEYWLHYDGTARAIYIQQTLSK